MQSLLCSHGTLEHRQHVTNLHLLLLCLFSLMQMSILSADSSKVSSQTVFERKMQDKLEQMKQSGKVFC
jgi:hypothetical protein